MRFAVDPACSPFGTRKRVGVDARSGWTSNPTPGQRDAPKKKPIQAINRKKRVLTPFFVSTGGETLPFWNDCIDSLKAMQFVLFGFPSADSRRISGSPQSRQTTRPFDVFVLSILRTT